MDLQYIRIAVVVITLGLVCAVLALYFDFQDFSWANNKSNYIVIVSGILVAISSLASYFKTKSDLTKDDK